MARPSGPTSWPPSSTPRMIERDRQALDPAVGLDQLRRRQQLGQDAVLGRRVGRGAEADDRVGQQRVGAEQHHQAADHLDACWRRTSPCPWARHRRRRRRRARARRRTARTSAPAPARCHSAAPDAAQQLDGGDEQGVVGQRAEELRRHDRVEASFHARRSGVSPGGPLGRPLSGRRVIARSNRGASGGAGVRAECRHAAPDRSPDPHRRAGAQPGAARAPPRPTRKVWAVVKANAYGHGIERASRACAAPTALRCSTWPRPSASAPRLARPGAAARRRFEPRDLELCSRLNLWHVVHCSDADRLAGGAQDAAAAARVPEAEQRHEPARLHARGLRARLGAPERAAAGRRDLADDALLRRRRRARHRRTSWPRSRPPRADLPGERSLCQQRRDPAPAGLRSDWVRAGIMVYGSAPDFPAHDIAHWDLQPTMTLRSRLIATQQLQRRRHGRLRQHASPPTRRCASASSPAATPTATRAIAPTGTPVLVDGVRTRTSAASPWT